MQRNMGRNLKFCPPSYQKTQETQKNIEASQSLEGRSNSQVKHKQTTITSSSLRSQNLKNETCGHM